MRRLLTAFALTLLAAPVSADEKPALEVGFAEADITPKVEAKGKPVYLAGFGQNRKATGVHDPLMARAVVLSRRQAEDRARLASISSGFFHANVERVRKELPGFDYVLVSSTHNHEGPGHARPVGAEPAAERRRSRLPRPRREAASSRRSRPPTRRARPSRPASAPWPRRSCCTTAGSRIVKHDELVVLQFTDAKSGKTAGVARAVELPPRDARRQEHAGQRRLRRLHRSKHLKKKLRLPGASTSPAPSAG